MRIIQQKESYEWNQLKEIAQKVDQSHLPFRMWCKYLFIETWHKEATPSLVTALCVKGTKVVFLTVFSVAGDAPHEIHAQDKEEEKWHEAQIVCH